jgi:thiol:disulfide interchange protein DsbD
MLKILNLTATLAVLALGVLRAEPTKIPHGTVELISAVSSIQPGSSFQVGLLFHLEPGWHIYWKNPGDSGQRPRLKWNLPQGLTAGDIEWPTPKRLPVGPLLDYGYEGEVLLPLTLRAAADIPAGRSESLNTNLRVLVCRETCMPGKAALSLSLPVRKEESRAIEANRKLFADANNSKPHALPPGWTVSASQSPSSIALTVAGGPRTENISFIPAHPNQIQNSAPQHVTLGPKSVDVALKRPADSPESVSSLEGLLLTEEAGKPIAYEIASRVTAAPSPETTAGAAPRPVQAQNLLVILLLAFGGGLILNLMPCVFPVLSIKILSLLDNSRGERKTIQISAAIYTLGVLFSFWVLVAVLLALRAGGRSLGWGFQLQAPGFVAFLICLLFVLGLSLIGAFEIGSSLMNTGTGLTQRGKYSSSFFTGVLATVVATPCTAPLMGVAVGFALSQSPAVCVAVFTSMAIGLASPFLLLSFFPQLSGLLPRPGAWMETLKQMMSFLIFGTVIWLLWVLGQQVGMNQLALLLFALLVLSIAAWIAGRWPQSRTVRAAAVVLGIGVTAYCSTALTPLDTAARQNGSEAALSKGGLKWEAFSPDKLASYRSSGKPVLVDFTAAWCLTCQVNDRVVFHSPQVEQRLNRSDIVLLRADWTSYDPVITEWLAKFGRSGIPFYIIYTPDRGSTPTTLPDGILTPSTFLKSLDKLKI